MSEVWVTQGWERPMKSSSSPGHLQSSGACLAPGLTGRGLPLGGGCLHPSPVPHPGCRMETALTTSLFAHPASFLHSPARERREKDSFNGPRARGCAGESGNMTLIPFINCWAFHLSVLSF